MVRKLAQADRLLGEGKDVADACRELQISGQTYFRWRNQFGGLKADDAKRLKELERENATLKRLLADAELEKAALKEIAKLLSPDRRRAAVNHLIATMKVSERFACRVTGQNRTTQRRQPVVTTVADPDAATASPPCAATPRCGVATTAPSWHVPQWPTGPANALACTSSRLAQRLHRSFNSRIRDECLNINAFWSLAQARVVISAWKHEYNHHRHTGIGLHTPADVHFGLAAGKAADRRAVLAAARAQHPHRFATTTAPKILDLHDTVWINRPAENSDTTEETQTTAA